MFSGYTRAPLKRKLFKLHVGFVGKTNIERKVFKVLFNVENGAVNGLLCIRKVNLDARHSLVEKVFQIAHAIVRVQVLGFWLSIGPAVDANKRPVENLVRNVHHLLPQTPLNLFGHLERVKGKKKSSAMLHKQEKQKTKT